MKILLTLSLLLISTTVFAQAVPLCITNATNYCDVTWDANIEADMHHYNMYSRTPSGTWADNQHFEIIHPTTIVTAVENVLGLSDGTHFLMLTAVDNGGNESAPSTELEIRIDRFPPSSPVIRWIVPVTESTTNIILEVEQP